MNIEVINMKLDSEINVGDIFYDSSAEAYYIFSNLQNDKHCLVELEGNGIHDDTIHNSFDHAIKNLKLAVKEQWLQHFSQDEFSFNFKIKKSD